MKHIAAFLAAVIFAALGAYVLWAFKTTPGLISGCFAIALAVAIALPTQLGQGVIALKGNLVIIVPVVRDALAGGSRRTDPPKDIEIPPRADV